MNNDATPTAAPPPDDLLAGLVPADRFDLQIAAALVLYEHLRAELGELRARVEVLEAARALDADR